jgi:hypothetical protein
MLMGEIQLLNEVSDFFSSVSGCFTIPAKTPFVQGMDIQMVFVCHGHHSCLKEVLLFAFTDGSTDGLNCLFVAIQLRVEFDPRVVNALQGSCFFYAYTRYRRAVSCFFSFSDF